MSARWGGEPQEGWPSAIRALATALLVAVLFIVFVGITAVSVDAGDNRCSACKIQPVPTWRPTPVIVGITPAPSVAPLPDTDALP